MNARAWMPLYVGDYLADTAHLNAAQHGAYLLLILHYWRKGGLPDDDAQLAQIARMSTAEWKRNRSVLCAFFQDGWQHGRIDRELAEAKHKYDRRAEAGAKGNAKRWGHRNAIAMGSQSQSQSHPLRGSLSQGRKVTNVEGRALGLAVVNGSVGGEL
ncbi:MAG: DUF1376 domain-containing protein [Pseudomonadota bacterium]|nr:DUF1376 domain-containing protein [Pseudomonadota bacterium]